MALPVAQQRRQRRTNKQSLRKERVFRDRTNPLDIYNDVELFSKFRFGRHQILSLIDTFGPSLEYDLPRKGSLPPSLQILVALRFFASGCFYDAIGDMFGVERTTVGRVIYRVSEVLSNRLNEYVHLPATLADINTATEKFYAISGFPYVFGCIDCTHVKIAAPAVNEHEFVNKKGSHSINVQLVCDADNVITNCVARWPGSVHDSRVLRESRLFQAFEQVPRPIQGIILGDNGYMLKDWLMTPYTNPVGQPQERYNHAHISAWSTIKGTIGMLKRRWRCLHGELRCTPDRACQIIISCFVLHNIATSLRIPVPEESVEDTDAEINEPFVEDFNYLAPEMQLQSHIARNFLVEQHFTHN